MKAKDFYEQSRKNGLTEDITSNPDPNYNHDFYQSIFRLMENFANSNKDVIQLNGAEIQSKHNRVTWAEGLILQLPKEHEGRNSWLINYGHSEEASEHRANWSDTNGGRDLVYDEKTDSYLLPRAVGV